MQTIQSRNVEQRGRIVVTDEERRRDPSAWAAYQEGNWEYFGAPRKARVHLRRLDNQKATAIEWE